MAKTEITLTADALKSVIGESTYATAKLIKDIAEGNESAEVLNTHASEIHDFAVLADKFEDASKLLKSYLAGAMTRYAITHNGDASEGFKFKNNGSTSSITDLQGLLASAEQNGANMAELVNYVTLTPKQAAKWLGLSDDRFLAEYGEFVTSKAKAQSLLRTW